MVRETAGGGESYYRSQAVLQAALVAVTRRLDRCDAGLGRDRVNRTLDYGFGDRCFATKLCPYVGGRSRARTYDIPGQSRALYRLSYAAIK